jgi:pyridoxine 4-dehydrogenase
MANTTTFKQTFTIGGDLEVNRMGYGAMRITGEGIWGPPKDHEESIRVLIPPIVMVPIFLKN